MIKEAKYYDKLKQITLQGKEKKNNQFIFYFL